MLQNNYPERLGGFYVLYPNFMLKLMFGIIKPFLDKKTKEKVQILDSCHNLTKIFTTANLPDSYLNKMGLARKQDEAYDKESKANSSDLTSSNNNTNLVDKLDNQNQFLFTDIADDI